MNAKRAKQLRRLSTEGGKLNIELYENLKLEYKKLTIPQKKAITNESIYTKVA